MKKPPIAPQPNETIDLKQIALWQLRFNLQKKLWFWVAFGVTFSFLIISNGFHFTATTFIFTPLLSVSSGYCLLNVRRLALCARFLKPRLKNKPKTLLIQPPLDQAFKITRRCLYQFCLSTSFISFTTILFLISQSDNFFRGFFDNLALLIIASGISYGISLLISHGLLYGFPDRPIVPWLSALKPIEEPITWDIPINPPEQPDQTVEIQDETLENWAHDPMKPASAEHQSSIWNRHHWDEFK